MKGKDKETLALVIITIPGLIWHGFVFKTLWLWFMVPLGLPILTIGHAIGINLLIMFSNSSSIKQNEKDTFKMILSFIRKPATVLLLSFIVKGFM